MKQKKILMFGMAFTVTLMVISTLLILSMYQEASGKSEVMNQNPHETRLYSVSGKSLEMNITLGAIGDILIHDRVYMDAKKQKGYDFNPMFQHVHSILGQPDLLLANQETVLGGTQLGLSGYPMFNSPQQVGDALVHAGVDIVSTANNHSLDKGEKGLVTSLNYLDKIGLYHVGTFRNPKEQETLTVLHKNGFKVAYLSYTYGTNGIPVPKGKDYLVNLIDKKKMKKEIKRAKDEADVVVMSLHWGNEYQRFPTDEQKELGHFLINEGVDVLFGHHPHVLQPMEWVKADDGRTGFIVYSLGNFLSGQMWDYKDIGGMATIQIKKVVNETGSYIELLQPEFYPTFVSNVHQRKYQVLPLQDAEPYGLKNARTKYKEIMEHMTKEL
ncbi:CapA family protein [Bacillus sp. 31A1R]|uniref:CapA family protein n=1 Tax=Robertmurraya mangrovi TaxID=3098077 RepID=A0ABU5J016_9BACI|nr:CapA family protein [Bacillus sp. 31A1R]MDZ5472737.1 CapA family protein [Bacillus sp. 31A1R]